MLDTMLYNWLICSANEPRLQYCLCPYGLESSYLISIRAVPVYRPQAWYN